MLQDNLLRRLVPTAVRLRGLGQRDQEGPGEEQQRSDPQITELPASGDEFTKPHGGGDVDGDELGDMRCGEGGGDHGGGRVLANSLDRYTCFGTPSGLGSRSRQRLRDCAPDVFAGDGVPGAGGGDGRQVDPEILGELTDRRFGRRPSCGRGRGVDLDAVRTLRLHVVRGTPPAPTGPGALRTVTDQQCGLFRLRLLRRSPAVRFSRCAGVDRDERPADRKQVPHLRVEDADHARVGRGKFDGGLGRLHLDDDLVDLDDIAGPYRPGEDLRLRQTLADVGEQELLRARHDGAPSSNSGCGQGR